MVDTNRIDPVSATARPRGALDLVDDPALADSPASGLVGAQSCAAEGRVTVETMDRPDGEVRLVVETATGGLLFLSEPYYPEREAWVDATPVPIARVNLAFSAIAVPPGRHAVLLRYVPRAFHWGLLIGSTHRLRLGHPSSQRTAGEGETRSGPVRVYTVAGGQIVHELRIYDFTGFLMKLGVITARPAGDR